jgi:hypothetical protein
MYFRRFAETTTRILANGMPAIVAWLPDGRPYSLVAATIKGGRIAEISVLADPDRLGQLDLSTGAG